MAPGKKKKKAAANPARGFATVSVASKAQEATLEQSTVSDAEPGIATPSEQAALNERLDPPSQRAEQDATPTSIAKLTPEELEAHLEDSELQSVLDAHASSCKANAARQVNRLNIERRQLRSKAHNLTSNAWLDDRVINDIASLDAIDTATSAQVSSLAAHAETKLLLDLWTLQRVLLALGLASITETLIHVLHQARCGRLLPDNGNIWGLASALDWYTRNTTAEQPMPYDAMATEPHASEHTSSQPIEEHPAYVNGCMNSNGPPQSIGIHQETQAVSDSSTSADEDNEEDDPTLLVAKYIHLRRKLWMREHQCFPSHAPLGLRKIREKIKTIERDVLFDRESAGSQWHDIEIDLQVEQAEQRKESNTKQSSAPQASTDKPSQANEEARDELFGDLFTAPGEELKESSGETEGVKISLLSFNKWSGLAPRHFLEQTCKSFDSQARVKTHTLSQTSYATRHKLELTWKTPRQPDLLALAALPEGVDSNIKATHWTISMRAVATSTAEQSIAYISTLALFLVLSGTAQEQQSMIRLPTVWRDEFGTLVAQRKKLQNDADKNELRELRELVQQQSASEQSQTDQNGRLRNAGGEKITVVDSRTHGFPNVDADAIVRNWQSRTAGVAWQTIQPARETLPIFPYKNLILETIANNPVSIICAETGSGKSTQTGAYILESMLSHGRDCRILVTQPRRISAISLARRVSVELGEGKNDLGTVRSLVGYAIRLESKTSSQTRLTFATTGVLLRMLESSPNLENLDYLILDEVHERSIEMDLLFIALRKLQLRRPSLKIILMSATVDARKFSDYFTAPILDIPGRTFPVETYFLEDAFEATNDIHTSTSNTMTPIELSDDEHVSVGTDRSDKPAYEEYSALTRKRLSTMDEYRIDYDAIVRLAIAIATKPKYTRYSSAILIFMPGLGEIRRLNNMLLSSPSFNQDRWEIHMLHSSFATEDLERAFSIPQYGRRKIVIATNIAETGITIPDVTAVIDTCKEKVMRFDERRQSSKLAEGFISRASAKQRRGRAARVRDGICFHLVTRHRHDTQMLEQQVPEMMRLSLQDPILRVKTWNMGGIEETFQAAIDPPSRKNVLRAIERLKDAGALTKTEKLTSLGERIARLPLDVVLAKLAILSAIFHCVDPVLSMISILTSKSIFASTTSSDNRSGFARSDSDLLTSLAAYEGWKKSRAMTKSTEFCRKNGLSEQNLLSVEEQKVQLLVYLVEGGLVQLDPEELKALNDARFSNSRYSKKPFYEMPARCNQEVSDTLLLSLIAMAFYPRVLSREGKGWRNVCTNQQVSLRRESINNNARPPQWLSFNEAMQMKSSNLQVSETSRVPDLALAVLLGEAEFKMWAGVVVLDNGQVKMKVADGRVMYALKTLRRGLKGTLEERYRKPLEEDALGDDWLRLLVNITAD